MQDEDEAQTAKKPKTESEVEVQRDKGSTGKMDVDASMVHEHMDKEVETVLEMKVNESDGDAGKLEGKKPAETEETLSRKVVANDKSDDNKQVNHSDGDAGKLEGKKPGNRGDIEQEK